MPTYKINYSGGKARVVNVNKLPNKTTLQSLDRVYLGQPFVNVVSKFQDTRGLDTVYLGQPFYGHTDAIAIPSSQISTTNHPDVNNWLYTVTLNGGSASTTTINALNAFCDSIDSAGLRNKFYRLNLFCGNNLNACLVPLFVGPSSNSIVFGNSIDINNNFTSSDYNETGINGGLKGNGSSKYLNTGLKTNLFNLGDRHLSVYESVKTNTVYLVSIGVRNSSLPYYWELETTSPATTYVYYGGNTVTSANDTSYTTGAMMFGNNISTTQLRLYKNGSLIGSANNANATNIYNDNIFVFALNEAGVVNYHTNAKIGAYSIGLSMDQTQITAYYNAMQTFQTALNRNI